jgi:hypothetical protein
VRVPGVHALFLEELANGGSKASPCARAQAPHHHILGTACLASKCPRLVSDSDNRLAGHGTWAHVGTRGNGEKLRRMMIG